MPTFFGRKAKAPAIMPVDGRAISIVDSISLAANVVANDNILLVRIPAGMEVSLVQIQADDLDTAAAALFRLGFIAADAGSALVANSTYFAAAGQTLLQTGGRLTCSFKPIRFEEDVYLNMTINTAPGTFAAGDIFGIVVGSAVGPK